MVCWTFSFNVILLSHTITNFHPYQLSNQSLSDRLRYFNTLVVQSHFTPHASPDWVVIATQIFSKLATAYYLLV